MSATDSDANTERSTTLDGRDAVAAARLQLLVDTRRQLLIHVPALTPEIFGSPAELDELRRIATSGRGAEIRLLLHDTATAIRDDHRLIGLAQRLPSVLQIRTPVEDTDRACASAWLLGDAGGYLFLPDARQPQGRCSRSDRPGQIPLRQQFDGMWERSVRARELQAIDL
ncbi:hypothetical protein [Dyella sp. A6]|uniref:DUF7931 domain-containing protein n=1 Tax=Dyella aluminiiresistens TaxID=3069105 RepID=UPI002E790100|nr:hypothetical protein [Dyella sp. A6]